MANPCLFTVGLIQWITNNHWWGILIAFLLTAADDQQNNCLYNYTLYPQHFQAKAFIFEFCIMHMHTVCYEVKCTIITILLTDH